MIKKALKEYNIVLIAILILAAAFLWVPYFNKINNLYNLLLDVSMYGILAVGVTFVLISGEVDLSVGMSVALSTVCAAMFSTRFGGAMGVIMPLVSALCVSGILAFLTVYIRMNSLIASIAIMTTVQGLCYLIGGGKTVPLTNEFIRSLYTFRLFDAKLLSLPVLVFILVLIVGGIILKKTRFGLSVYVAGGNAEAGYMSGVKIGRTKVLCFLICGFLAGIMAIFLTSFVYCGAVAYGDGLNLTVISACVLGGIKFTGGKGGMLRTLLGILVIRVIVNITSLLALSAWAQNTITGTLLIVILILDRYSRKLRETELV